METKDLSSEIGALIDMSEKDFRKFFKKKNLGYIKGCETLITVAFSQLSEIRKSLVQKCSSEGIKPEDDGAQEYYDAIQGAYSEMMKAEQKVFILRDIFKSRMPKK